MIRIMIRIMMRIKSIIMSLFKYKFIFLSQRSQGINYKDDAEQL